MSTSPRRWNTIAVEISGSVAYVRFDRAEDHNTVTPEMADEIYAALLELSGNDEFSVVVLTGNGSTFCPGADLNVSDSRAAAPPVLPDPGSYHSSRLLSEMPQLTLAAINGGCAGAGFAWASACDLRVATSRARFATAFLEVGLSGELGLAWTLQRHIGTARARELCFLPRKFDAAEALALGFVSRVFDSETYATDLAQLVGELASRDRDAIRTMKRNFVDAMRMPLADYIKVESDRHRARFTGPAAVTTLASLAAQGDRIRSQR